MEFGMKPSAHTHASLEREGVVLLDSKHGVVFALNPIGALIWEGIEKGESKEDLVRRLTRRFPDVASSRILLDLDCFLLALADKNLITV